MTVSDELRDFVNKHNKVSDGRLIVYGGYFTRRGRPRSLGPIEWPCNACGDLHPAPVHDPCNACGQQQHSIFDMPYHYFDDDGKPWLLCDNCVRGDSADPRFVSAEFVPLFAYGEGVSG